MLPEQETGTLAAKALCRIGVYTVRSGGFLFFWVAIGLAWLDEAITYFLLPQQKYSPVSAKS